MNAAALLPDTIAERLGAFLLAGKTGSLTLNIKNGNVLAYELRETGQVQCVDSDGVKR